MPSKPPFTAHLGNLSYDVTESDVQDFFADCAVTHVRIIEDKIERKPKGFGYVEFGTLDGLKKALDLSGSQLQGRNVKVTVAEPRTFNHTMMRNTQRPANHCDTTAKDRPDRPEPRVLDDWTRKGPLPDLPNQRRASERGFSRNFDNQSDAGSERGGSGAGERRRPQFEGDGKPRDFGNWERKGPLSPVPRADPPVREGGRVRSNEGGFRERRQSPAWGEGRSQDGPRPPRSAAPERAPTQAEMDNQWRARMKPDATQSPPSSTPEASTPSSPAAKPAAPAQRPRLNLQKRTVSEAQPESTASASGDAKASPFGAARPVNTAEREAQVAERKERERKEAEDRAKEEKKKREEAAKAKAAAEGAEEESTTQPSVAASEGGSESKENGTGQGSGFEVLDEEEAGAEGETKQEDANGKVAYQKPTRPQRDLPVRKQSEQGSWRRAPGPRQASHEKKFREQPSSPSVEQVDADGWSTVPKNTRGRGRGGAKTAAS